MISPDPSSATSEGTRFAPSSPGITTGRPAAPGPCADSGSMYATREFVVPRSIPTMRSASAITCSRTARLPSNESKHRARRPLPNCHGPAPHTKTSPSSLQSRLRFQRRVDVAHQVADVRPRIQYFHHRFERLARFRLAFVALPGAFIPRRPGLLLPLVQAAQARFKALLRRSEITHDLLVSRFAHLLRQLQFLQLHVQFEHFFQQLRRDHLLLLSAAFARAVG